MTAHESFQGAAASFDRKLDEATVKGIAGEKWNQELYDSLKDEAGCITIDQFLAAAATVDGKLDEYVNSISRATLRVLKGNRADFGTER